MPEMPPCGGCGDCDHCYVGEAMHCVETDSAGHWPTVAGYLSDEVNRLRGENVRLKGELEGASLSASYYQAGIESWHSRELDVIAEKEARVEALEAALTPFVQPNVPNSIGANAWFKAVDAARAVLAAGEVKPPMRPRVGHPHREREVMCENCGQSELVEMRRFDNHSPLPLCVECSGLLSQGDAGMFNARRGNRATPTESDTP